MILKRGGFCNRRAFRSGNCEYVKSQQLKNFFKPPEREAENTGGKIK